MERVVAPVTSVLAAHPLVTLLRVEAPSLVTMAPGQFVMAKIEGTGWDPFLREPLFAARTEPEEGALALWVPGGAPTRERLRALPLHARLDLLGPLGRGTTQRREWRHLLLVAEGLALGPLLALMQGALAAGQEVALLNVVPPGQEPYPADALPVSIEYQRAPRGGAREPAREMLRWADGVVAAGSQGFYRDLVEALREARPGQRDGFAYGLLLEPFGWQAEKMQWGEAAVACALAACRACQVELRRDKVLACADGPVFDLWTL
jgi:NAD(P)H-flavin reductase